MFWKYTTSSNIESILEKDNFTLEELLQEEDLVQECKSINKKLIDFLAQKEQIQQLIRYMIDLPDSSEEQNKYFKYGYIACDIFCCDQEEIQRTFFENPDLLDQLFRFLQNKDSLQQQYSIGYFSRVVQVLIGQKPEQMYKYFQKNFWIIELLIDKLDSSYIQEVFLRLCEFENLGIHIPEAKSMPLNQWVGQWLSEKGLIYLLLDKFEQSNKQELQGKLSQQQISEISNLQAGISEVLQANAMSNQTPLLNDLVSKRFLTQIINIFRNDETKTVPVIRILINILQPTYYFVQFSGLTQADSSMQQITNHIANSNRQKFTILAITELAQYTELFVNRLKISQESKYVDQISQGDKQQSVKSQMDNNAQQESQDQQLGQSQEKIENVINNDLDMDHDATNKEESQKSNDIQNSQQISNDQQSLKSDDIQVSDEIKDNTEENEQQESNDIASSPQQQTTQEISEVELNNSDQKSAEQIMEQDDINQQNEQQQNESQEREQGDKELGDSVLEESILIGNTQHKQFSSGKDQSLQAISSMLNTPYGQIKPPLGSQRLKIVEYLFALVNTGLPKARMAILSSQAIPICLDLFSKYPYNNILHHIVLQMLLRILDDTKSELVSALFEDINILQWIVDRAYYIDDSQVYVSHSQGDKIRYKAGYHGHLTKLSNKIMQISEVNQEIGKKVQENEAWQQFVSNVLTKRNNDENTSAWECGRPIVKKREETQLNLNGPGLTSNLDSDIGNSGDELRYLEIQEQDNSEVQQLFDDNMEQGDQIMLDKGIAEEDRDYEQEDLVQFDPESQDQKFTLKAENHDNYYTDGQGFGMFSDDFKNLRRINFMDHEQAIHTVPDQYDGQDSQNLEQSTSQEVKDHDLQELQRKFAEQELEDEDDSFGSMDQDIFPESQDNNSQNNNNNQNNDAQNNNNQSKDDDINRDEQKMEVDQKVSQQRKSVKGDDQEQHDMEVDQTNTSDQEELQNFQQQGESNQQRDEIQGKDLQPIQEEENQIVELEPQNQQIYDQGNSNQQISIQDNTQAFDSEKQDIDIETSNVNANHPIQGNNLQQDNDEKDIPSHIVKLGSNQDLISEDDKIQITDQNSNKLDDIDDLNITLDENEVNQVAATGKEAAQDIETENVLSQSNNIQMGSKLQQSNKEDDTTVADNNREVEISQQQQNPTTNKQNQSQIQQSQEKDIGLESQRYGNDIQDQENIKIDNTPIQTKIEASSVNDYNENQKNTQNISLDIVGKDSQIEKPDNNHDNEQSNDKENQQVAEKSNTKEQYDDSKYWKDDYFKQKLQQIK